MSNLQNTDVVILCGGKGERLQPVLSDKPKVLADFGGKPFLEILINSLKQSGFKRFILSIGYKREMVIDYFKGREDIVFSEEETALGTGGGLKKAKSLIKSDTFLVLNGDSLCQVDFNKMLEFHRAKKALLTMVLARILEAKDCGTVTIDNFGRINSFREKVTGTNGLVSAGIYLMDKEIFSQMPAKEAFSLEYDLFPKVENSFGYVTEAKLYDIGTPERYSIAKQVLK